MRCIRRWIKWRGEHACRADRSCQPGTGLAARASEGLATSRASAHAFATLSWVAAMSCAPSKHAGLQAVLGKHPGRQLNGALPQLAARRPAPHACLSALSVSQPSAQRHYAHALHASLRHDVLAHESIVQPRPATSPTGKIGTVHSSPMLPHGEAAAAAACNSWSGHPRSHHPGQALLRSCTPTPSLPQEPRVHAAVPISARVPHYTAMHHAA
jgi:hypothetical protein